MVIRVANKTTKYKKGAGIKLTGTKTELQDRLKAAGRWHEDTKKVGPPKIAGVTWAKGVGGDWTTTIGGEYFFFSGADHLLRDDDYDKISVEALTQKAFYFHPILAAKPKAKTPSAKGKSITIKFDRNPSQYSTSPIEAVGHMKGKNDIVYEHKGENIVLRKYTHKMLHSISHSGSGPKWAPRDPSNPNQYYYKEGFGYKTARSFILINGVLREQDIDAPLSSMAVGYG